MRSTNLLSIFLIAGTLFGANHSYYSTFGLTNNPISEGSQWTGGQSAGGNLWGDMQTTPGLVFGVSEPTVYGDPTALLTGTWGANQTVQATVHIVNSDITTGTCCHELEVRLRNTITANSITGYEVYCSVQSDNAYCHIARWNGANGSYCNIEAVGPSIYLHDGDVLKGTVTGTSTTIITLYVNGTQQAQATDTGQSCSPGGAGGPFTSGQPGVGQYDSQDSKFNHFGFSSMWATDGVPVLTTTVATSVTSSTASSGGAVVYNGGASVSSEGTCANTSTFPTSPCTSDGTSTPFTSSITGLSASTTYNYRACATNANGTGCGWTNTGADLQFSTGANSGSGSAGGGNAARGGSAVIH